LGEKSGVNAPNVSPMPDASGGAEPADVTGMASAPCRLRVLALRLRNLASTLVKLVLAPNER
jgi:hypothetical protein